MEFHNQGRSDAWRGAVEPNLYRYDYYACRRFGETTKADTVSRLLVSYWTLARIFGPAFVAPAGCTPACFGQGAGLYA